MLNRNEAKDDLHLLRQCSPLAVTGDLSKEVSDTAEFRQNGQLLNFLLLPVEAERLPSQKSRNSAFAGGVFQLAKLVFAQSNFDALGSTHEG